MTDATPDPESAFADLIAEYEAEPFPHVVATGVFNHDLLRAAYDEMDQVPDHRWVRYMNAEENKRGCRFEHAVPNGAVRAIEEVLSGPEWIACLEDWFGIADLEPDGMGGGMHSIDPGGHLGMHVDFNRHDDGRYRRINCLVYLNESPHESGDLILMDDNEPRPFAAPLVRISPEIGTVVCFETSERSWHGHPYHWQGKTPRRSVAMYYFTADAPAEVADPHTTIFTPYPQKAAG